MKKSIRLFLIRVIVMSLFLSLLIFMSSAQAESQFKVAVFVPGVTAGSPLYEQMVEGATKAVEEYSNASLKVVEGGFNQAEWPEKVTSLAATGEYNLIVTSNPSLPFICADVAKNFSGQKFLCVDGILSGNPQIHSLLYNQVEQGYIVGYLGGLITKSTMSGATPELKAGMIVGQQYPAMDKMIKPGFEKGLKAVDPNITLDYRVVGNWYDANKAAALANSMMDAGVDVIAAVAGGANQGTISAAKERGRYVVYFDSNEYKLAPGTIIGCGVLNQKRAVYERVKLAIEGKLIFGIAEIVGFKDGYIDFADKDPDYINNIPEDIRKEMNIVIKKMRSGELSFEVPEL
ncbi:MAG TPA: BMP family ABC transporter substrate-binding protein [Candidatus Atribacteria bacterium]|nr:BMP family ABC transporter substrate-binding protein [Candidatus Atribacteria bacterium]